MTTGSREERGFTLVEMVVAAGVMMAATSVLLTTLPLAEGAYLAQPEAADVQQRLRVASERLRADLVAADAVLPYRVGENRDDPSAGTFYRRDTITLLTGAVQHTYYLNADDGGSISQLRHYDGRAADFPVLDDVASLSFQYIGPVTLADMCSVASGPAPDVALAPAELSDGPWCPDDGHPQRFDADLLRIRRVRVALTLQASRQFRGPAGVRFLRGGTARRSSVLVPDVSVTLEVTPRNLQR